MMNLRVTVCPICSMESMRISICKNGSISLHCASCFFRGFMQDLRMVAVVHKIGEEMRAKGHTNRIQYIEAIFSAWRDGAREEYAALEQERSQVVTASAKGGKNGN